jgi:hypothetical protein
MCLAVAVHDAGSLQLGTAVKLAIHSTATFISTVFAFNRQAVKLKYYASAVFDQCSFTSNQAGNVGRRRRN